MKLVRTGFIVKLCHGRGAVRQNMISESEPDDINYFAKMDQSLELAILVRVRSGSRVLRVNTAH